MGTRKRTTWTKETAPAGPGRPPASPELRAARKLTKTLFESIVHEFTGLTKEELLRKLKDPETKALELMVGTVVKEAITNGDQQRLDFILNRLVGKPKEEINVYGSFSHMSEEQLLERARNLLEEAKGDGSE